ncbi:DUF2933 domain-containing protein [Burkholderia oklahomensis]|uniref:DUF2933 domain-containing protein n=1 Tax=Burkholderia oklahomensis TaxID=342113 RepID=UPI00264B2DC3|nr:DUF2933 domain-containing protein [Burkholderia oklahomensis]MDN7674259.1 DUF2933 domain-containing protein [Burkholderia oklahomensis]
MNAPPAPVHPSARSSVAIGALAVGAIAAFVPLPRHRYPVLGFPPYLLLLACPPAHLVMRRGHRHRRASGNDAHRDSEDDHERHR